MDQVIRCNVQYVPQSVELIVPLLGLHDDQICFPTGGLPQGNILPFSSVYSSPV